MKNWYGRFLTFEGVEGSGKTTQIELWANYLRQLGVDLLVTREPGGTRLGEAIRTFLLDPETHQPSPMAELCLFNASRAEHLSQVVIPAIREGRSVLCDRYFDASVAYQGSAKGLGLENSLKVCLDVVDCWIPWRTVWLDVDPRSAIERAQQRETERGGAADRFEREPMEFHLRVRDGYRWLHQRFPGRILRIDASGSPEKVFERTRLVLENIDGDAKSP